MGPPNVSGVEYCTRKKPRTERDHMLLSSSKLQEVQALGDAEASRMVLCPRTSGCPFGPRRQLQVRTPFGLILFQIGVVPGLWTQVQEYKFQRGIAQHAKIHNLRHISSYHCVDCMQQVNGGEDHRIQEQSIQDRYSLPRVS
jgi:hypothetical protein